MRADRSGQGPLLIPQADRQQALLRAGSELLASAAGLSSPRRRTAGELLADLAALSPRRVTAIPPIAPGHQTGGIGGAPPDGEDPPVDDGLRADALDPDRVDPLSDALDSSVGKGSLRLSDRPQLRHILFLVAGASECRLCLPQSFHETRGEYHESFLSRTPAFFRPLCGLKNNINI